MTPTPETPAAPLAPMAPRIEAFELEVCPITGDPGCMGCIEGSCAGCSRPQDRVIAHQCSVCNADDVYGELEHQSECPLYGTQVNYDDE